MKGLISIGLFLLLPFSTFAQQLIKGYILDFSTKKPIEGAHINAGKKALTSSDKHGYFQLQTDIFPAQIKISHIGYFAREFTVSEFTTDTLPVYIIPRTQALDEVVISPKSYLRLFKTQSFYVQDFAIKDNRIWAVGFVVNNTVIGEFRMISLTGSLIDKISISNGAQVFQDPTGSVHLFNSDTIKQLFFDGQGIAFINPLPIESQSSKEILLNLQIINNDTIVFRSFNENRSLCEFIAFNSTTEIIDTIFSSFDRSIFKSGLSAQRYTFGEIPTPQIFSFNVSLEVKLADLKQKNPTYSLMSLEEIDLQEKDQGRDWSRLLTSMGDGSKETRLSRGIYSDFAFDRTIRHRPIQAAMFRSMDRFYVFENPNLMIWALSRDYITENVFKVEIENNPTGVRMIQDPISGSLFLTYLINGAGYVCKIDQQSITISSTKKIDGFPFAEKIQIYNNRIYFIHQSMTLSRFTNLYSIPFE